MTSRSKYGSSAVKKTTKRGNTKKTSKGSKASSKVNPYKRFFLVGSKEGANGLKIKVLRFTSSEVAAFLGRALRVHEEYTTIRKRYPWYIFEEELKIKYRKVESLLEKNPKFRDSLAPFVDYIKEQVGARTEVFKSNFEEGFVLFEDLWLLYPEGSEVVFEDEGALVAGLIEKAEVWSGWYGTTYSMTIELLSHTGEAFVKREKTCGIVDFTESQLISNLPVRPLDAKTKEVLSERGRKALELIKAKTSYAYYSDEIIHRFWWGVRRSSASGRCMLDPKTFKRMNENYELQGSDVDSDAEENPKTSELSDKDLWRVSPWIPGFSFSIKEWGEFNIEHVEPIQFNEKAYDQLVLPSQEVGGLKINPKHIIRSLVEHGTTGFTDIISDKGGGIIFLLHGPPGTGKTLTAESVADLLKKPLYSVSVGELGTSVSELETKLRRALEVATIWNAVLLIDEADIFLEKRTPRDVERNALVAIFLRTLEYYQGVLFITTNRVKQIDPAFHSRLSIALHYPSHGPESRIQIWKSLLAAADLNPKKFDLKKLSTYNVNGRQIKHAIRIGLALAAHDNREVTFEDFMQTIMLAGYFQTQLHSKSYSSEDMGYD